MDLEPAPSKIRFSQPSDEENTTIGYSSATRGVYPRVIGTLTSVRIHGIFEELPPEIKELPIEDLAEKVISILRQSTREDYWPEYILYLLKILLRSEQAIYDAEHISAETTTDGGTVSSPGSARYAKPAEEEIPVELDNDTFYSARAALRSESDQPINSRHSVTSNPSGMPGADPFSPHHPHRGL